MTTIPPRGVAAALAVLLVAAVPDGAGGQRVGIFFDEQATLCAAPIEPSFGRAHAWMFAFLPPDSIVSGVSFALVLPAQIGIVEDSFVLPREPVITVVAGDLVSGIDLRIRDCPPRAAPLLLCEFDLEERSFVGPRPNLGIDVRGAVIDSLTSAQEPQLRLCDSGNPMGEGRGFMIALGVDGILNCTARCGCTTALLPGAWSAVKTLFR